MNWSAQAWVPTAPPAGARGGCALLLVLGLGFGGGAAARAQAPASLPAQVREEETILVLDPGHGGANPGALNPAGVEEKRITLALALRVKTLLEERSELRIELTRQRDHHLGLAERARIANQLGAALLLSIHCNSAPHNAARGYETFFLDLRGLQHPSHPGALQHPLPLAGAPDGERPAAPSPPGTLSSWTSQSLPLLWRVPAVEQGPPGAGALDEVAAITSDLRAEADQRRSERLAWLLQEELALRLPGPGRGVRQAAYDVLLYAASPAAVVEVGFANHPEEGVLLADPAYQERIAQALTAALLRFVRQTPGGEAHSPEPPGQPFAPAAPPRTPPAGRRPPGPDPRPATPPRPTGTAEPAARRG